MDENGQNARAPEEAADAVIEAIRAAVIKVALEPDGPIAREMARIARDTVMAVLAALLADPASALLVAIRNAASAEVGNQMARTVAALANPFADPNSPSYRFVVGAATQIADDTVTRYMDGFVDGAIAAATER